MHRLISSVLACLLLGLCVMSIAAAEEPGFLGFSINVDGEGFFLNPTLKSATIVSVAPSSPAANAGIAPKDQIVEVEGHAVVGAKGRDIQPLLKKAPGQSVRLKLKRPTGEEYAVTLVAASPPAKP